MTQFSTKLKKSFICQKEIEEKLCSTDDIRKHFAFLLPKLRSTNALGSDITKYKMIYDK